MDSMWRGVNAHFSCCAYVMRSHERYTKWFFWHFEVLAEMKTREKDL